MPASDLQRSSFIAEDSDVRDSAQGCGNLQVVLAPAKEGLETGSITTSETSYDETAHSQCNHFDESKAHGRWPHATFHVITTFIGAGVLALPWTIALVGWIPGMALLCWGIIWSIHSACILTGLHEINGTRAGSYREICTKILGPFWGFWSVVPFQMVVCIGQSIKYLLVAGKSLSKVYNVNQCEDCIDMRMT